MKKETLAQVFSCEFCEIFQNIFFDRTPVVDFGVRIIEEERILIPSQSGASVEVT